MVKKQKARKGGLGVGGSLMLGVLILLGAAFLPTTTGLLACMLPTMVAFLVDPHRDKTLALTVGMLNFSSCFPFLLNLFTLGHTMDAAFSLVMNPVNIIIMYAGAAAGYFIDWTLAGISNVVMTARAHQRQEAIKKRQQELVSRWGLEVTGDLELDADGFPLTKSE